MANRSEAYDFSLFEDRYSNTAPVRDPKKSEQPKKNTRPNVVELPEKELKKNARSHVHPLQIMAALVCCTVIFLTAFTVVYSQVQLTELTEQINLTNSALAEAESLEIQLNMQEAQMMNGSEVEKYAVNELGLTKITGTQVTYVNVAQQDKGTVVQDSDGGSFFNKLLSTISGWFN